MLKDGQRFKVSRTIFGSIRAVGSIFEVIGAVVFIIAIAVFFMALSQSNGPDSTKLSSFLVSFAGLGVAIIGLFVVAVSELGLVAIETENNTRISAENSAKTLEIIQKFANLVDKNTR